MGSEGRLGAVAALFQNRSSKPPTPSSSHRFSKMTSSERAEAEAKLKARAKKVLADTKAFPQELFFVGRSLNIIRSANFSLGSVVNRVAILAECAASGSALRGEGFIHNESRVLNVLSQQVAIFKFRARVQSFVVADRIL